MRTKRCVAPVGFKAVNLTAGSLRPSHPTPAAPSPDVLRGHRARFKEGA